MTWTPPAELPANTVPYIRAAVTAVSNGQTFSEFGWQ